MNQITEREIYTKRKETQNRLGHPYFETFEEYQKYQGDWTRKALERKWNG